MVLTAVVFFVILSILIFVHELGHFAVARWIGVHVEEFGFGLPPRIWGKKVGRTIYSLNWLPIGGFVKLAGEDENEGDAAKHKGAKLREYFFARSKKERAAILGAGVTMNFLLAVAITAFLLTRGIFEPAGRVHVERVIDNSPAQKAGIKPQDLVTSISFPVEGTTETRTIVTPKDLIETTRAHAGEQVTVTIERQGERRSVILVPRKDPPPGEGAMGVAISDLEERKYSWGEAPVRAFVMNVQRAREMLVGIGVTLWRLVQLQSPGADVAGPIGIAQVTGQAVRFGWRAVLEFMSILSLNLAVLNALPIPALDGGRLLFVFLEKVLGRRVRPAFEHSAHQVGMIILLFLVLLVSIHDIVRLARGG